MSGLYPSTFISSLFSTKIQFLYCLLSSVVWEFRSVGRCKIQFSWIFLGIVEFYWEEKLTRKIHAFFLYARNQRVRRMREQNTKSFKVFSKTKKKKHKYRISSNKRRASNKRRPLTSFAPLDIHIEISPPPPRPPAPRLISAAPLNTALIKIVTVLYQKLNQNAYGPSVQTIKQ